MRRTLILFPFFALLSCGEKTETSEYNKKNEPVEVKKVRTGEDLYLIHCNNCHGVDGKLGNSGAKDLSISTMSDTEIVEIIKKGKGGMMPFETILNTQQQLDSVTLHVKSLRND